MRATLDVSFLFNLTSFNSNSPGSRSSTWIIPAFDSNKATELGAPRHRSVLFITITPEPFKISRKTTRKRRKRPLRPYSCHYGSPQDFRSTTVQSNHRQDFVFFPFITGHKPTIMLKNCQILKVEVILEKGGRSTHSLHIF